MRSERRIAWVAAVGAACAVGAVCGPADAAAAGNEFLLLRAEQGDAGAQFELGLRYLTGKGGTEPDPIQSTRWFLAAAEQGNRRAQMNLSTAYAEGRGVEKDQVAAVEWLLKAAEQGHPRAMVVLGERFLEGRGVSESRILAHMWTVRAASLGSPLAQVRLAGWSGFLTDEELKASRKIGRIQRERVRRAVAEKRR